MNPEITSVGSAGYGISQEQRHRVLRNTYWLLALSLIPTVLGAWVGVATGITQSLRGGVGLIVFLGGAFGFMYAIEKTKRSAAAAIVLMSANSRVEMVFMVCKALWATVKSTARAGNG